MAGITGGSCSHQGAGGSGKQGRWPCWQAVLQTHREMAHSNAEPLQCQAQPAQAEAGA